jgi:beta-glucosidase
MGMSNGLAALAVATVLATGAAGQQAPKGSDARASAASSALAHPDLWPKLQLRRQRDPKIEARIDALLSRMSIEDKVGQLIQVDIASITPKDLETYKLGSILNGGNSAPNNDEFAPAPE